MLIIPFFPVFARRPGFDRPPILPYYFFHTQINLKQPPAHSRDFSRELAGFYGQNN